MTFLSVMSVEIANVVKTVKGGQNGEFWSELRSFQMAICLEMLYNIDYVHIMKTFL